MVALSRLADFRSLGPRASGCSGYFNLSETAVGAVVQYLIGAAVVAGIFGVVVAIYWRRAAPARERRAALSADPSRTWLADINIDRESLGTVASSTTQEGPVPRSYALTSSDDRFELWGAELLHGPAGEIEFRSVLGISAPLNGTFYGAGQFEFSLTDSDVSLGVQLVSPVLSGAYHASPGQVDRLILRLQQLLDNERAPGARPS